MDNFVSVISQKVASGSKLGQLKDDYHYLVEIKKNHMNIDELTELCTKALASVQRPASIVLHPRILLSYVIVHNFQDLLSNRLANQSQVLCKAYLGRGN